MKHPRLPIMILTAVLRIVPICRLPWTHATDSRIGFAFLMKCCLGASLLAGSHDTVSGASAAIAGVANVSPIGPATTNAVGAVSQPFAYRIVVQNAGVNPQLAFVNVLNLPPGLTINTNLGGNGLITGTPTVGGVYFPVTLEAGNANYGPTPLTFDVMFTINGPPTITSAPTNRSGPVGTNVSFTVTASGTAPLSYRWQFAGTNIAGGTNATLQLTNVQISDTGTYLVAVTNAAGSNFSSATLTVTNVPPSISTPPQNLTVTNGDSASFVVVAGGTALTYQWSFKGTNITGATAATLQLINVQASNAGPYTVTITNSAGSASATANLTVNPRVIAPTITSQPQSLTVTNGNSANFTVVVSGTAPGYQWRFNLTNNLVGATSASLVLTNVQATNAGDYTVVVTNAAGSVTSVVAHLTVQIVPPIPILILNPQQVAGHAAFDIQGPTQASYVVLWASNLVGATWWPCSTNSTTNGRVQFTDPNSRPSPVFYRVKLGP